MTAVEVDISTLTPYQRGTYDRMAPIVATCDCPAGPGAYCRSKSGHTVPFHKVRKEAVAAWPPEKRIAAVAVLRATRAEQQAAARRAQEALAADPARPAERAASHRRQQAAWDATAVTP